MAIKKNLSNLVALKAALATRATVQVGIFAAKTSREEGAKTNAEIGAIHELGSAERNIPKRSWLRMPLEVSKNKILSETSRGGVALLLKNKAHQFWVNLGIAAEQAIQDAFDTGGFGNWAPLKYETLLRRLSIKVKSLSRRRQLAAQQLYEGAHHVAILVDSAQLRHAVSSRVV